MARIIQTGELSSLREGFNADQRLWIYNGLDAAVTGQIRDALAPLIAERSGARVPYQFVRAMQAPALDMMLRGIRVNPLVRRQEANRLKAEAERKTERLNVLARAVWGQDLNPNSSKQLIAFFYTALGLPVQYTIRKTPEGKKRTPSCDHGSLEAIAKLEVKGPGINKYDRAVPAVRLAAPFVALITGIRDVGKKLAVVNSGVDADERLRCSYNVVGARTGRWSSSSNAFGRGTNLQNITEAMRRMCCADDGWKLGCLDLEQAESRMVAALVWAATGDDKYWAACESGDLHTVVATMSWPDRFGNYGQWDGHDNVFRGDLSAARGVAEGLWYRHLSFRDGSKRIGHGSNYWGTPFGIAHMIGDVEAKIVRDFQDRYFRAFPAIPRWHSSVIREVQTEHKLTTPLGRERVFFGRASDDATLREAIAHVPQSTIAELLNLMLYRVWRYGIDGGRVRTTEIGEEVGNTMSRSFRDACQLLLQVHDCIIFQYPDGDRTLEAAIIEKVNSLMTVDLPFTRPETGETRMLRIPAEPKVGWNWARTDPKCELFKDGNPDGLSKWKGSPDPRQRQQSAKPALADWLGC